MFGGYPVVDEKALLKETVRRVIVGQGNRFIKELLRDRKLPIGSTKADFSTNLMKAIDDGALTVMDVESWLVEVEGWGNQHIYFFKAPDIDPTTVRAVMAASPLAALVGAQGAMVFPDELQLSTIDVQDNGVLFAWHRGNDRWIHVPTKDQRRVEDGDLWEYRAFRQRSNRTVVRFEWRFDLPYCSIMMQLPNEGTIHTDCLKTVWEAVSEAGLVEAATPSVPLTNAVNALSGSVAGVKETGRKMQAEGAYLDMVSTVQDVSISQVEALRAANGAIDPTKFHSADGRFRLDVAQHGTLSRTLGFDISGGAGRARIAVQCLRHDIHYLSDLIWERNVAP